MALLGTDTHRGFIGVFDSGIGGLSVANAICGLLPRENLLYVADNARAPYGQRSLGEIRAFSLDITERLLRAGVKLIVVACNTATSAAIDHLRERYPDVPFVGLEPAIKPAAAGRSIGVLATEATLRSDRYRELRARYLTDRPVWENPCRGLVPLIEADSPELDAYLVDLLAPAQHIDTLVLGCTHYPLVQEQIAAALPAGVRIIDPSLPAARQVVRRLEQLGAVAGGEGGGGGIHDFLSSGSAVPLQRTLLRLPELNQGRRWLARTFAP